MPLLGKEGSSIRHLGVVFATLVRRGVVFPSLVSYSMHTSFGVAIFSFPLAAWEREKPVGVEALAGGPAATTFNGAPTPTG